MRSRDMKKDEDPAEAETREAAAKFLMKRGLNRDKALYVTSLVRMAAELKSLRRLVKDEYVKNGITDMLRDLGDEVEGMYEVQEYENSQGGNRGA